MDGKLMLCVTRLRMVCLTCERVDVAPPDRRDPRYANGQTGMEHIRQGTELKMYKSTW